MDEDRLDPYAAPSASTVPSADEAEAFRTGRVKLGQKLVLYAILFQIVAVIGSVAVNPMLSLLVFVSIFMSMAGVILLGVHLFQSAGFAVLFFVFMFIPLINLLTLLFVNSRATRYLKERGYRVGLMGAQGLARG